MNGSTDFNKMLAVPPKTAPVVDVIRKKRPGFERRFLLHHDNAPSHSAAITQSTLADLGIETLSHPPYSPDLAPCDFYLFPTIKAQLRGRKFDDVDDLPVIVRETIRRIAPEDYKNCFYSWVRRWEKCVRCAGEYFEKM